MTFWDILVEEPFIAIREIQSVVFRKILVRTTFSGFYWGRLGRRYSSKADWLHPGKRNSSKPIGDTQSEKLKLVTSWSEILLKANR